MADTPPRTAAGEHGAEDPQSPPAQGKGKRTPKKSSRAAAPPISVADYIASTTQMAPELLKLDSDLTHGQVPCGEGSVIVREGGGGG